MTGKTPPERLPWIGVKVVDVDGREGVVAHYQYYEPDQVWFPVEFPERFAVPIRRCRLGKVANRRGFVRLAEPLPVTSLALARKPPHEPSADTLAEHAAAS